MSTTELTDIRHHPSNYTWGKIHKFHDIGRYTIVEYKRRSADDLTGDSYFAVYVEGKDQRRSCSSLDQAIIVAVATANVPTDQDAMALAASKVLNLV